MEPGTFRIESGRGKSRPTRRVRPALILAVLVVLLIAFAGTLLGIYTDYLWFVHDAQQPLVFDKTIRAQAGLWVIGLVVAFFAIYMNAHKALSSQSIFDSAPADENARAAANVLSALQKFGRLVSVAVAAVVAFGVAESLSSNYQQYWAFLASTPFGRKDPLFGLDIGFFVFRLPWLLTMINTLLAVLVTSLLVAAAGHFGTAALAKIARVHLSRTGVATHLSILAGLTTIVFGSRLFFTRYLLGVQAGAQFTGPGYALNKVVAFYAILGVATVVVGVFMLVNARFWRPWAILKLGVPLLLLAGIIMLGVVPNFIQKWRVDPNLLVFERPYAERAIESTRFAYGLDRFQVQDFAVKDAPTPEEVKAAQASLKSMRLWDPTVLQRVYDERQSLRPYYEFYDVDVDRYKVDGEQRMVMIAPRDLKYGGVAPGSRNWQNQHLRYTHGFGVVMTPVNEAVNYGQPQYWVSNFPPEQGKLFPLTQQRIYFANYPEGSPEYDSFVLLHSKLQEFDYPAEVDQTHTWTGKRGIPIDGALAKFAFSAVLGEVKLYTTNDIDANTRIVLHRDIIDRASKVYPFLSFDGDPYIVIDKGRVKWIMDGYTTSDLVPYSTHVQMRDGRIANYIRNSVKIVIDAYNGDMTAYAVDDKDPVLQTWRKVFPGLVHPSSEVPTSIREHFRYAEDFFDIQSEILTQYHVTDPVKFLSNEDAWQIPQEIGRGGDKEPIESYYVEMRLPGTNKDGFMLIRPFSPRTKNNMIGWMAANCDPEDYGKGMLYQFPRDTQTQGPLQMESSFNADPIVADINRQFNNDQSSIVPGNLLVIPIGSSLLYVKPLFLESKSRPIPELRKVILGLQNKVVVADTYDEALAEIFGASTPDVQQASPQQVPGTHAASSTNATAVALEALQLLDAADAALRAGDFTKYGELQKQAKEKLRSLAK
ncbi:MAG TPA: UPF0182 family protein [Fimbriimonadaceae bacterium]|nr:UPF0182 family protein [Fimbriimonadaceae bacterium]